MLKEKYKAFEITQDQVIPSEVDGNLPAIAKYIMDCGKDSIITLHTTGGDPFLISLSKAFVFCSEPEFLDDELIPHLRGM